MFRTRRSPRISLFQGPSSLSAVVISALSGSSFIRRQCPIQRSRFSLTSSSACGLAATPTTSARLGWSSSGSGESHSILVTRRTQRYINPSTASVLFFRMGQHSALYSSIDTTSDRNKPDFSFNGTILESHTLPSVAYTYIAAD